MAIRQDGGELTFSGKGTVVTNFRTGFLTGHAYLFNENGASLTNTGKHTKFSDEDHSYLFNSGNGTRLTNEHGATLTVRHAYLLNAEGATLTNTGRGTQLINEDNSYLTNTGNGTTIINERGATLTNSHSYLLNADGATISNRATGTIENRDHATFVNQALLNNDGKFDNRALFDDTSTGVVSGSGTYTQSHGGSTEIDGSFTQHELNLFGGTFTAHGAVTVTGNVVNDSTISIDGSSLTVGGNVRGHGTIDITDGSATFDGAVSSGQTVIIDPSTITIVEPSEFSGTLELSGGDTLIVDNVTGGTYANGVFTFTDNGHTVATIDAPGYSSSDFSFSSSGGNLVIHDTEVPCFCRGTLISLGGGSVQPVERLKVGDRVMTLSGAEKPIVWIGRGRRIVGASNPNARPIIVRAGALAKDVPLRDLYLTRGHSLYLAGVLIPVEGLINGCSILWDESAREVEFYHLQLPDHDVILAENAAAESYRDDGNRDLFDNPDPPRFAAANMAHYAPVLTEGPIVDQIWHHLFDRSGFMPPLATTDPDLHLLADGQRIDPCADENQQKDHRARYRFRLGRRPRQLLIASRHFVPIRMGLGRDQRQLGVAIRSIDLDSASYCVSIDWSSTQLNAGFNAPEDEAQHRWTNGSALIPSSCFVAFDGPFEVQLEIVCTGKYPLVDQQAAMLRAA
jgi:hypothetical protein